MRTALFSLLLTAGALAADPDERDPIAPGIRESQLTVSLEKAGKRTQFQATVIAKGEDTVTVLTAGHGLRPEDVGAVVRLRAGDDRGAGLVESVRHNPGYHPGPSPDIPGADNAIATFRIDPGGRLAIDRLRAAEVSARATPEPSGKTLTVQTVDQFGAAHVVKAGNYSNPRWLEWGPSYRPAAGDSGSGVFIVRLRRDGSTGPVLIGVVVDRSQRGGGASLLHLKDRWVQAATRASVPKTSATPAAAPRH